MAPSITSVQAITLEMIQPRLADNVFLANPTAAFLLQQGRVEVVDGSRYIQKPLMYTTNTTAKTYSGYDTLDTTAQEELTAVQYNWRQMAVSASISGLEEMQNSGSFAKLSLWSSKLKVAEQSLQQLLDYQLHVSYLSKGAKDWLGLDEFVDDTATPIGTVGGISRNTESWWRNKVITTGTLTTQTQDMRRLYNLCSEGNRHPDYITCPYPLYENYENQNAGKQRISNVAMLDAGFENLMFKGATMVPNRNCIGGDSTTGPWNLYMLTSEFLTLTIHRDRNFAMRQPQQPINQDATVSFILLGGNATLNNSRFQGVLVVN